MAYDSDEIQRTLDALAKGKTRAEAAAILGIAERTLRLRQANFKKAGYIQPEKTVYSEPHTVTYPIHPDDDIPVEEIIKISAKRFEKRHAAFQSRQWQTIKVHTSDPVVIAFVGDPHLDDDGCNWPLLLSDIELMKQPHVYAVNIGDQTNNWTGRLMRLYAKQETSASTGRKLVKWFLTESGIRWLVWIMGNHDEWENGSTIIRLMNTTGLPIEDWSAKFTIMFDNGCEVPVWAAHQFKGTSQWNNLHGPMKAALMRAKAALYVCGHTHDWAMHSEELPDGAGVYWALRARGYKFMDHYATVNGFPEKQFGSTMAAVINPRDASPLTRVLCFPSLSAAVAYRDAI